ncbi:MFS transporter [Clostridium malenominatum]|uniref:MFS transporter n=1 Tax=Clostridium malenominatum TaxID=1539 RepID=A0ABN1IRW8_9CLOT
MEANKYKLKSNIVKNYIFIFLNRLDLTQGVWMIYLAVKGMSLTQLGILEGIFHLTSFCMEVPTGVVADLWGRKISRILGRAFSFIGTIVLIFSNNFYMFALSFAISAISYNLESGAGDALIYDSLKEIGKEEEYMKVNGNKEMFMQIGTLVALPLGGYLAAKNYLLPFVLSAVIACITLVQAVSFVEPDIHREKGGNKKVLNLLKTQVVDSVKVIKNNKKVGFFIVFINVISLFITTLFYYLQNYWKVQGHSEFKIGIYLSISSLLAGIMATKVYKLERILKEKGILVFMPFIIILALWGIALTDYSPIFYVVIGIADSIAYVTISDYINKLIPSENRATILSFESMVFSFLMIFIFPLIGKIGDAISLNFAFKVMAGIGTIMVLWNTYVLKTTDR